MDSCCLNTVSTCPSPNFISWEDIKTESMEDKEIQALKIVIKSGFPEDSRSLPNLVKPYAAYQSSLYILDKVVMLGDRVVIPLVLRPRALHSPPTSCCSPRKRQDESESSRCGLLAWNSR